jgi:hypothetical protein
MDAGGIARAHRLQTAAAPYVAAPGRRAPPYWPGSHAAQCAAYLSMTRGDGGRTCSGSAGGALGDPHPGAAGGRRMGRRRAALTRAVDPSERRRRCVLGARLVLADVVWAIRRSSRHLITRFLPDSTGGSSTGASAILAQRRCGRRGSRRFPTSWTRPSRGRQASVGERVPRRGAKVDSSWLIADAGVYDRCWALHERTGRARAAITRALWRMPPRLVPQYLSAAAPAKGTRSRVDRREALPAARPGGCRPGRERAPLRRRCRCSAKARRAGGAAGPPEPLRLELEQW